MGGMRDERRDTLHGRDFDTWTQEQAQLRKTGQLDEADLANIAEEIETSGRSELSSLGSTTS